MAGAIAFNITTDAPGETTFALVTLSEMTKIADRVAIALGIDQQEARTTIANALCESIFGRELVA